MSETKEKIGSVSLDYTFYPGEDLYSDGDVEEKLLEIAGGDPGKIAERIAEEKDWAVLYHFSPVRENIVSWIPFKKTDKVLEIGAGCGAVTGALAAGAGSVTCVELSRRRSRINALRHRDMEGIEILVGNYGEIEPGLAADYDYVTLIGVFEYASSYIEGDSTEGQYLTFLKQAASHLKPGGTLVMAIENRLGLKYWAGCREDHTGGLFDGLEDYPRPTHAHTFSKPALEALFARAGFAGWQFYYPFPDYKLPTRIFSDGRLPLEGELPDNIWNFDRERLVLFDEGRVWDSLIRDGLFPLFANSFLVTLTKG